MKHIFSRLPLLPLFAAASISLSAQGPVTVTQSTANAAQSAEIKEMQQLEDKWSEALVKHDQYSLELLLSPLYVGISSNGEVSTRNQQISLLFQRTNDPITMEQRVISARMLGDVVVVNGTYLTRHHAPTGNDTVEERGIFTHVFQKVRSNWLCINSQRTVIGEESSARAKATAPKPPKKSNAELPFHVPFLHKGAESTAPQAPATNNTQPQQSQPPQ